MFLYKIYIGERRIVENSDQMNLGHQIKRANNYVSQFSFHSIKYSAELMLLKLNIECYQYRDSHIGDSLEIKVKTIRITEKHMLQSFRLESSVRSFGRSSIQVWDFSVLVSR